jgi:acyl dehydratase
VRFASPACGPTAQCTLKSNFGGDGADSYLGARVPCYVDDCAASGPVARPGAPPLQPLAFTPARLSSVVVAGWLADEVEIQTSTGQTGQLGQFWGPVSQSVWLGGTADGYLHEDAPYFLQGAVPLAILVAGAGLADPHNLSGLVDDALAFIAANQSSSGWLGPDDTRSGDEYWSRYNVLSAFLQRSEGRAPSAALIPAALRYVVAATRRALDPSGYQINDWSAARAHDFVLTMHTLIDRFDEFRAAGLVPAAVSEATLFNAAAVAHAQALGNGAVWEAYFASPNFPNDTVRTNFGMLDHGVK